jgi:RNA-directed DNA polymerase
MEGRMPMPTFLQGIANKARTEPKHRFGSLYELLNEDFLMECWSDIRKDAAYGVDRVSAQEYAEHLDENIHELVERLKQKQYHARLVRRQYIPKGDRRWRPLGIPVVEDKLLQLAVTRILQAIYEQDFLPCSYGYRPQMGALDAVDRLTVTLQFGPYQYVVDADIRAYFDTISHDWLMRMLAERIEDGAFLRLIRKWLQAGVLDTDGQVLHPATGTPQGGVVSPILANVFLHYVLDLWFEKRVKRQCRRAACLFRFADDFVCAFENRDEAEQFYREVGERLKKFGLELAEDKTRVIAFSRHQGLGQTSFDFLGFEFRWGKARSGKPLLKRRTARKKLRNSLQQFKVWCQAKCRGSLEDLFRELNAKLRGYYQYYGVHGNFPSLHWFFSETKRILFKWLNRRSQRRSYNWAGFQELLHHFRMERPRIVGRPKPRLNVWGVRA